MISLVKYVTKAVNFTFDSGHDSLSKIKKNVDGVTLTLSDSFPRKSCKANNNTFKQITLNKC